MLIAFFKENNSQNYNRKDFEVCSRQEAMDKINKLSDDELSIYDMENEFEQFNFMSDFNDGLYGSNWLCAVIEDEY